MVVEWRIGMRGKESDCDQIGGKYMPTNLPFTRTWTEDNHGQIQSKQTVAEP